MAAPTWSTEFSLEAVRQYILGEGGTVTNRAIAKRFKPFLSDPSSGEEAKTRFKDYVNTLTVVKRLNNDKVLVLKKKYNRDESCSSPDQDQEQDQDDLPCFSPTTPTPTPMFQSEGHSFPGSGTERSRESSTSPESTNDRSKTSSTSGSDRSSRHPSRHPSPAEEDEASTVAKESTAAAPPPPPVAPPRKKSMKENKKPVIVVQQPSKQARSSGKDSTDQAMRISVKEQALKLNRIASESQLVARVHGNATKKRDKSDKGSGGGGGGGRGGDNDDDSSSVATLDPRSREWLVKAAQADYQALAKSLKDEPRLAKQKDFISGYTALHWGAKHGSLDIVKLIAGTHELDINIRSHGGYTPLHLAAMHGRREAYELLIQTYHADPDLRDYGGRKARQYIEPQGMSSPKSKSGSQRAGSGSRRTSEKDLQSFLRIGSLNVKVRKTAERLSAHAEGMRKAWGSADSIPETSDDQLMPPPKCLPTGRRQKHSRRPASISTVGGMPDSIPTDYIQADSD